MNDKQIKAVIIIWVLIVGLIGGFLYYRGEDFTLGATILTTNSTNTLDTFITNVNTSLNNLNSNKADLAGDLGGSSSSPTVVDLTITNEATGTILYFTANGWEALATGTSNQVLTMSANTVTWSAAGGAIISTSSAITVNQFPYWASTTGQLSGTSTLQFTPATSLLEVLGLISSTELFSTSGTITNLRVTSATIATAVISSAVSGDLTVNNGNVDLASSTKAYKIGGINRLTNTLLNIATASASSLTFDNGTSTGNLDVLTISFAGSKKQTKPVNATGTISITIENETGVNDNVIWIADRAGTIRDAKAVHKTNLDTAQFNIGFGLNRSTATTSLSKFFCVK